MNKELLFQLYCIHSESGMEKKMRKFLRKQAKACGATSVETDRYGNLLIVKGESDTYPCLAAHMDQVQRAHSKDFRVIEIEGDVLGWSPKSHGQQGLGADDKNGLFICLELLKRFDVMKVAFFVEEECGGHGSDSVDLDFFKDCRFVIEPDRKGNSDLITSMCCGDVCSKDFIDAIGYKTFGYHEDRGTFTDVANLVERGVGISCLNLSCGYYHAHTDEEITVLSHLENCMNFVAHIVENCTDVYPFKYERPLYNYGSGYGRYGGYGWYGGKSYDSAKTVKQILCPATPALQNEPDFDEIDYYDSGQYNDDYDMMCTLIDSDPEMTFDEIIGQWSCNFFCKKADILKEMYDDVQGWFIDNYWDEDNEVEDSVVWKSESNEVKTNKKVS